MISERQADAEGRTRWFEFNDKRVKPFDVGNVAEATFGGEQTITFTETNKWGDVTTTTQTMERTANAFILMYDRQSNVSLTNAVVGVGGGQRRNIQRKNAFKGVPNGGGGGSDDERESESESESESKKGREKEKEKGREKERSRIQVPQEQLLAIWEDNAQFCRLAQALDPHYFAFMEHLINLPILDTATLAQGRLSFDAPSPLLSLTAGAASGTFMETATLGSLMKHEIGDRVKGFVAKFRRWYSGVVIGLSVTNQTYRVDFDDNTEEILFDYLV